MKLNPAKLNFGTEKVGSKSVPQTIQMTNVSSSSLDITKIQLAGNDPKDFTEKTNCSSPLAAHASCTFTITFDPEKTGSRIAALQITDNGGGSPQSVQLTGTKAIKWGRQVHPALPLVPVTSNLVPQNNSRDHIRANDNQQKPNVAAANPLL